MNKKLIVYWHILLSVSCNYANSKLRIKMFASVVNLYSKEECQVPVYC